MIRAALVAIALLVAPAAHGQAIVVPRAADPTTVASKADVAAAQAQAASAIAAAAQAKAAADTAQAALAGYATAAAVSAAQATASSATTAAAQAQATASAAQSALAGYATSSALTAVQAAIPVARTAVPLIDTPGGMAGSAGTYVPGNAQAVRITRAGVVQSSTSTGAWAITWATPLPAAPVTIPIPVNATTQPVICNVATSTMTGATGRCWLARTLPSALVTLTALVTYDVFGSPATGIQVQVLAIPMTQ